MPRTAVTPTVLTANDATAEGAGTTIDGTLVTNGVSVALTHPLEEHILEVTHTSDAEKDLTVAAGDDPPADAAGQGALVEAFAAGNVTAVTKFVGPLTSSRFIQNDGTLHIDFETGFTGTLRVIRVPRI